MSDSIRLTLAEYTRLHLEPIKATKPADEETDSVNTFSNIPGATIIEDNFAQYVASGMLKFRQASEAF